MWLWFDVQACVMRTEEDANTTDHLEHSLLDDAHLVLPGTPDVTEKEVILVLTAQRWCVHLRAVLVAQPARRVLAALDAQLVET